MRAIVYDTVGSEPRFTEVMPPDGVDGWARAAPTSIDRVMPTNAT